MNVSFIVAASPDVVTGPRNSVTLLAKSIMPFVSEVSVFSSIKCEPFKFNDIAVEQIDYNKLIRSDIVVFSGVWFFEYIKIAGVLRNKNIPYIVSPRSSLMKASLKKSFFKKVFFYLIKARGFLNGAAAIHFLTEDEKNNSFFSSKGFVIGNIVNDVNILEADLEQNNKKANEKIISFLGRFDLLHKGLDVFLEAIIIAANELRDKKVKIRMFGPDQCNGSNKLKIIIENNNLKDIVNLGGKLEGKEKAVFLTESDFFVHTSRYEGQPQAVMEAMMCGCPILVTPGTNMVGIVEQSKGGVVAILDPTDIAKKLVELLNSDSNALSINSYSYARKYFTEEYVGSAFFQFLRKFSNGK